MDKFVVDLDKVLDDFELEEDQAELTSKIMGQSVHNEVPLAESTNMDIGTTSATLSKFCHDLLPDCNVVNDAVPSVNQHFPAWDESSFSNQDIVISDKAADSPLEEFTKVHSLLEEESVSTNYGELLLDFSEVPMGDLDDTGKEISVENSRKLDGQKHTLPISVNVDSLAIVADKISLLPETDEENLEEYLEKLEKEEEWNTVASETPENTSSNTFSVVCVPIIPLSTDLALDVKNECLEDDPCKEDEENLAINLTLSSPHNDLTLQQSNDYLPPVANGEFEDKITGDMSETFNLTLATTSSYGLDQEGDDEGSAMLNSVDEEKAKSNAILVNFEDTRVEEGIARPFEISVDIPEAASHSPQNSAHTEQCGDEEAIENEPIEESGTISLENESEKCYANSAEKEQGESSPNVEAEGEISEDSLPESNLQSTASLSEESTNSNSEDVEPCQATPFSSEQEAVENLPILPEPYSSLTDDERSLGLLKPVWIPDEEAAQCMNCSQRFTVIRRRHHCRACGRVLCSNCCSSRAILEYMESKEARVCLPCLQVLKKVEAYKKWGALDDIPQMASNSSPSHGSLTSTPGSSPSSNVQNQQRVNPNNPLEYCSTVPPPLQAAAAASLSPPTVMVPVGVLKKEGTTSQNRSKNEQKQVIFSDGIRPGGDLAELDSWRVSTAEAAAGSSKVVQRRPPKPVAVIVPSVPDVVTSTKWKFISPNLPAVTNDIESVEELIAILADSSAPHVTFALQPGQQQSNKMDHHVLLVTVKLIQLDCCVRRKCWCFTTRGMRWVAQDEIVILLEQDASLAQDGTPLETLPPADIFSHLLSIYQEALNKHHVIVNLGHTVTPGTFLGSSEHGGLLFFRASFQCVQKLILPPPPYLIGVLLRRWEIPWAKVFPLRLLLRLGAEFRYYPCPLFSVRNRKPMFGEIGHTIVNLLADMRNFSYTLPSVAGLVVHMEERETNILLPRSRYQQVCKALAQSNDHVISLAASFSPNADAHLVCLQLDDGSYQTQAINIHTKPRKVTGASFVVFNGALKSSSGLSGRSSIVEDGVMVQLLPDTLAALKQSLIRMEDYVIFCGKVDNQQPEETVTLKWINQEPSPVNFGVTSPIDGRNLTGISSIRVMQPRDYKGDGHRLLRWTEMFLLQTEETGRPTSNKSEDGNDVTRLAEAVAKATCMALAAKLSHLSPHTLVGLRVSLTADSVEYQAGADQKPIPSSCTEELDSSLVPLLHRESASQSLPCVTELWFRLLHPEL